MLFHQIFKSELIVIFWETLGRPLRHDVQLRQAYCGEALPAGPQRGGDILPRVRTRHAHDLLKD